MAASGDHIYNILQSLRARFPEVSDDDIWRVMTQNQNDFNACYNTLQKERENRHYYGSGQRTMTTSAVDLRERQNDNGIQSTTQHPKHRYSEPNVQYQRNISEATIHLEQQQRPVSAPPDRSSFILQYPLQQYINQTPNPTPVHYSTPYNTRITPPARSYSTSASLMMNQPDHHPTQHWTDPQQRYATTSNNNHQYNISSTSPSQVNNMVSSIHYVTSNNLPSTPASSRSNALLHHALTSPELGRRQMYPRQLNLMATPNDHGPGTPPPIKPMMSPASSLSSLTDSPEVKPDLKQPPLPLTKEQEDFAYTQALLLHQRMRYDRLSKDYKEEKENLEMLKQEVESMEKQLGEKRANKSAVSTSAKTVTKLSEQNRQLEIDIKCMTREIELHKNQGKYSDGFYQNIGYTGAPGPVQPGQPDPRAILPNFQVPRVREDEGGSDWLLVEQNDDQQWSCNACTFLNHPALHKCETCDSPRGP
ncbi:TGF-beta-activated kinase 1 and MAP3K7-binding protein 2-like [Anneissia japonica]|uniref:TGF-beta-activated kinase 1 and MAP3K7-binding protein 2-like n=1 Tax=Anneissia japonica TaxID=1529436 RepID=UPI0014257751|nr:TGF-beta-activated kinase 1 and MAP3K7-binding protein 2-like [Anneissia japonica]XP_033107035.1 TGF-beta-activated kinase 1 and MAP3K7-binding protein 2-like [Anneissia japonica]XP_033107036.1 TGF-beta-activated kinase 1 and MAP3K7-binding protein 2-like [Anneissia japonica]